MLSMIFYYVFSASVIVYYGAGLNRIIAMRKTPRTFVLSLAKTAVVTLVITSIGFLLDRFVFIPLGIIDVSPFVVAALFITASFSLHTLVRTGPFDIVEDYVVPFMIVLVSMTEGSSYLAALAIDLCSVVSFYLLVLIVFALRRRFRLYQADEGFKPILVIIMSLCAVFIAFYGANASWLDLGLNL